MSHPVRQHTATPGGSDESDPVTASTVTDAGPSGGREFRRGFRAMTPLWAGAAPFAVAFAVVARGAGFSVPETVALSAVLFAGSSQLVLVGLTATGAGLPTVVAAVFALNLRHLLYGLSLAPHLRRPSAVPRPLIAFVLTDEAYGLAMHRFRQAGGSAPYLFGAGLSLYAAFNVATLAGALLGAVLPDPSALGLDFIFPLSFLALLAPLVRTRRRVLVAATAAGTALLARPVLGNGGGMLAAALLAAGLGALLDTRGPEATP